MKKFIFILIIFVGISITSFGTADFSSIDTSDNLFGSPEEIIDGILNNEFHLTGKSIIEKLLDLLLSSLKNTLPHVLSLLGISILLSVVEKLKLINSSSEQAALMGGRIIFSVILVSSSLVFLNGAKDCLYKISEFCQALLPIIMTLLASLGAQGTVTILGPSQMLMSTLLINICTNIIFPLIAIGFVASAINGILSENKLKGVCDLMKNTASWLIGGVFSVFSAIITLQGIVSGFTDGISIKSIKYALSSSVPIIGSTISDSFSSVLLSAFSIKSAAGIMGIIIIIGIVIVPIINLWAYIFVLNCFGAVVEPFAGSFITEQIRTVTEFLKLALIVLVGVSVLWFIFLGVIVAAGGSFI